MSNINIITYRLAEPLYNTFKNGFRVIGDFYGRSIKGLQNLPKQLNDKPLIPLAIIATTNIVFFTAINAIANLLNTQIEKSYQLSFSKKIIKNILLDGVVVGGCTLAINYFLSKAISYPLSKFALAAITIAVIAGRVFVCNPYAKDKNVQAEQLKKQEVIGENTKEPKDEANKQPEAELKQQEIEVKKQLEKEANLKFEPEQAQQEVQEVKKQLEVIDKLDDEAEQAKQPQEDKAVKQLEPEAKMQLAAEQAKKRQEDEVKMQEEIKETAKIELQKKLTEVLNLFRNLVKQKEKLRQLPKPHSNAKKMMDLVTAAYPNNEAFKLGPTHQRVKAMYEQLQVLALPPNNISPLL